MVTFVNYDRIQIELSTDENSSKFHNLRVRYAANGVKYLPSVYVGR